MAGIYLHVPFCGSKCVYCGFYSVANTRQKDLYLDALHQEIDLRKGYLSGAPIRTIYFGGGTPSLLELSEIEKILQHLGKNFDLSKVEEITLEANPEQLSLGYCQALRQVGVNRLSIGVQSFQDHVLRFMGRRHTAAEAQEAIRNARAAGFSNISLDLIYGVAERDDQQWRDDIATALRTGVTHLSCYALTPEENSILYKQIQTARHAPVDDEQAARQYEILLQALRDTAFQHYEVSNFALPGYASKHNASYWDHTPYLGLGPAAHSFNGTSRQWNAANISQYAEDVRWGNDCDERETLSPTDLFNEAILLGLRTRDGLDLEAIATRYGAENVKTLRTYFQQEVNAEHYEQQKSRLRLTEAGLWFADGIAAGAFIVED